MAPGMLQAAADTAKLASSGEKTFPRSRRGLIKRTSSEQVGEAGEREAASERVPARVLAVDQEWDTLDQSAEELSVPTVLGLTRNT